TINVYSLRAKDRPTVSTPVSWQEVEQCLQRQNPELLVFTSDQVLERIEKAGDQFAPVLQLKQKLPALDKLGLHAAESASQAPQAKRARSASSARPRRTVGAGLREGKSTDH